MKEYMNLALQEALKAYKKDEVPVGAIIVKNGKIIAKAHNLKEKRQCVIEHAEIIAIRRASKKLRSWHLDECIMYVTLEPCQMCMGAIINARLSKVYIGAKSTTDLNWQTPIEFQPNTEAQNILVAFFRNKR